MFVVTLVIPICVAVVALVALRKLVAIVNTRFQRDLEEKDVYHALRKVSNAQSASELQQIEAQAESEHDRGALRKVAQARNRYQMSAFAAGGGGHQDHHHDADRSSDSDGGSDSDSNDAQADSHAQGGLDDAESDRDPSEGRDGAGGNGSSTRSGCCGYCGRSSKRYRLTPDAERKRRAARKRRQAGCCYK